MKRIAPCPAFILVSALVASSVVSPLAGAASANVSAGVNVGNGGLQSFDLAVCEHYRVKQDAIIQIRARTIPDDHIPIVLFIAERARCAPDAVIALRAGGKSWMDIAVHFKLGIDVFYVEVKGDYGPPYGRALGHFKHRARNEWGAIRLADEDVACLVNLQFLAARHRCSADDIVKLHANGDTLVSLHGKLKARGEQAKAAGKNETTPADKTPGRGAEKQAEHGKEKAQGAKTDPDKPEGNSGAHGVTSGKGKGETSGGGRGRGKK